MLNKVEIYKVSRDYGLYVRNILLSNDKHSVHGDNVDNDCDDDDDDALVDECMDYPSTDHEGENGSE